MPEVRIVEGSLMIIPKPTLVTNIDSKLIASDRREHLGASQIGHKCSRYLFYHFRWAYENEIESRVNRIFKLGDCIEKIVIESLAEIGMYVSDTQRQILGTLGHFGGSIDGIVNGMLFECKSMNDSNFKKCQKVGVKKFSRVYYWQMQSYMGYLRLEKALFCAMNKNTSSLYIEEVEFDEEVFEATVAREREIICGESPEDFERIGNNISWHECRYCNAREVCHFGTPPSQTCRSCTKATPVDNGQWHCSYKGINLSKDLQLLTCMRYETEWN